MVGPSLVSEGGVSITLPEGWGVVALGERATGFAGPVDELAASIMLVEEPGQGSPSDWWARQRGVLSAVVPLSHEDTDDGWLATYAFLLLGASVVGVSRVVLLPGRTLTATGAARVEDFEHVETTIRVSLMTLQVAGLP